MFMAKKKLKIAIVFGTRPEFIKFLSVIKELEEKGDTFFIVHTGQHYSENLDSLFFKELRLPTPQYHFNVGSLQSIEQVGLMLSKLDEIFKTERPDIVLVEGDTNSALSGALAAVKNNIHIGHIEAGLRSGNLEMREERNRIVIDHYSSILFAPTKNSIINLISEGIDRKKIILTGNTVVDAAKMLKQITKKSIILEKLNLKAQKYLLVTIHRAESTERRERLEEIVSGLNGLAIKFRYPIIFPIHPRTQNYLNKFGLKLSKKIRCVEPLGYFDFNKLLQNCLIVLTDSGGVQEEACILKVPAVTLREDTERPETIKIGANAITGYSAKKIISIATKAIIARRTWPNPFGSGGAGKKIISEIENYHYL